MIMYWKGCGEPGTLIHWWVYKIVQPLCETVWEFLQKLNLKLIYHSVVELLIYLTELKIYAQTKTCKWIFIEHYSKESSKTTQISIK